MSIDILKKMQIIIKQIDLLENDIPVSIGFTSGGKVIVRHSLTSIPFFFNTVEEAIEHIENYVQVKRK